MRNFLTAFRDVHRSSLAFAAALPLVFAIPLVAEFIQHVVEMQIGMYDGVEGAKAADKDPARLWFGFAKVVALNVVGYFVIRWLHSGGNRAFALAFPRKAVTLFGLVLALSLFLAWLSLFVWTEGYMGMGFFVFSLIFMPLIVRFVVAAPLGILVTPLESIRVMASDALFAIVFSIAAILPLMVVHYALGIGAIFIDGDGLRWTLLVVDSFVTALLGIVMVAAQHTIATRPAPIEGAAAGTSAS
jgi:hypothetical protein